MKYIIVEIIPDALTKEKGNVIQLSALKIDGIKLIDRFDYRLNKELIKNDYLKEITNYDNETFKYLNSTNEILKEFRKFIGNDKLLIMDNEYTNNFLNEIKNKKESIFEKLEIEYTDDVIDKLKEKYNLEDTNHIVDILYESLIYKSNQ